MAPIIQLGNQIISSAEIIPLLAGYQMLPQLCRELIINKEIADIQLTSEELNTALQQFYQKNQLTTVEALAAALKQHCMTQEQLEALATKELRLEKFKQATWGGKLEQYFLQYKPQLDKVLYSLLRTEDMHVAQELYFRIKAGEETFAECAKEYSQGSEANTGGLIGPVPISQPHPAIAQKLSISQAGQLWPPIKVENWVVIVRLEKLIPAQLDDATKQLLLNHLFEQWLASELKNTAISVSSEIQELGSKKTSHTATLPQSLNTPALVTL